MRTPVVDLTELDPEAAEAEVAALPDGYVEVWHREKCHPDVETATKFDPAWLRTKTK